MRVDAKPSRYNAKTDRHEKIITDLYDWHRYTRLLSDVHDYALVDRRVPNDAHAKNDE